MQAMGGASTVLSAKGIRRLIKDHAGYHAAGASRARDARAWASERARAGTLLGIGLAGAAAPPMLRPPIEENPAYLMFAAQGQGNVRAPAAAPPAPPAALP